MKRDIVIDFDKLLGIAWFFASFFLFFIFIFSNWSIRYLEKNWIDLKAWIRDRVEGNPEAIQGLWGIVWLNAVDGCMWFALTLIEIWANVGTDFFAREKNFGRRKFTYEWSMQIL